MVKKILCSISIVLVSASLVYAGNLHNSSDIGHAGDSYGSYSLQIWGGGDTCTMTHPSSGAHTTGLKCPGFIKWEQYNPAGTTLVTYWSWFAPSGVWKISSGSAGDSNTGYGIPTDTGFNMEASGATM